jgi:hypothetical protein
MVCFEACKVKVVHVLNQPVLREIGRASYVDTTATIQCRSLLLSRPAGLLGRDAGHALSDRHGGHRLFRLLLQLSDELLEILPLA